MADTILNPDGKIVGVYPTMYQEDHDRMKGETEAHNRKADKARAEIERKAARARKAALDESERRAAIVEGLRRFAKKAARAGDDDLSKKLNTYVESTEKALAEYERILRPLLPPDQREGNLKRANVLLGHAKLRRPLLHLQQHFFALHQGG